MTEQRNQRIYIGLSLIQTGICVSPSTRATVTNSDKKRQRKLALRETPYERCTYDYETRA